MFTTSYIKNRPSLAGNRLGDLMVPRIPSLIFYPDIILYPDQSAYTCIAPLVNFNEVAFNLNYRGTELKYRSI